MCSAGGFGMFRNGKIPREQCAEFRRGRGPGFGLLLSLCALATVGRAETLSLLTRYGYIDHTLVKAFEEAEQVDIQLYGFATDEQRDRVVVGSEGRGFDILMVDGPTVARYAEQGWLARLDGQQVPNLRHVSSLWAQAFPEASSYAVPYAWGTVGIAYRADLLPAPITAWRQLFEPARELRGRITLIDDAGEVVGMALKSLGYSLNSADPRHLQEVEELLRAQGPYLQAVRGQTGGGYPGLGRGSVLAAMMRNDQVTPLRSRLHDIAFVHPVEGSALWCDYIVVTATSPHRECAFKFLDFINIPRHAAQNAQAIHCATPNLAAERILPESYLGDTAVYPPAAIVSRCEYPGSVPAHGVRARYAIFTRLVTGSAAP